jgi:hypothetical protein
VTKYGWDRHVWDVPISELVPSRYTAWWAELCFVTSTGCTKVSILLFYRRMTAATMQTKFLYVIFGAIVFIVAYTIAFDLVLFVGCRPLSAYWDSVLPTYTQPYVCYDEGATLPASSIISIITDIIVLALPCSVVWHMQMPFQQKLTLSVVFGVGLVYVSIFSSPVLQKAKSINVKQNHVLTNTPHCRVIAAGIIRTIFIWQTVLDTYDETWVGYDTWLWTSVESNLAIICACTPALKPFFSRYLGASLTGQTASGYPITSRSRIGTIAPEDSLSHSRSRDIELGRSTTDYVSITEISKSHRKSLPTQNANVKTKGKNVVVTTELSVIRDGSRKSQAFTDDEESVRGGYTSSTGSTRDLSRPHKQ